MKIVLDVKRGSNYNDEVASRYHFPSRYLRTLEASVGDWAVFRRPRDGGEGIAYFGVGLVVGVAPDEATTGYYYASISDYLTFPNPVEWKPNGVYAERALRNIENVSEVGIYLRGRSVRSLDDDDFEAIVDIGLQEIYDPEQSARWWPTGETNISTSERASIRERRLVDRAVRDASFRKIVCEAYEDRCAITRLRLFDLNGRSEVQAAHIQPIEQNGPDVIQNGLALSATAHWMFDRYLITIDPEYRLVVADDRLPAEVLELCRPSLTRIHLPKNERLRPTERFLRHHRELFGKAN